MKFKLALCAVVLAVFSVPVYAAGAQSDDVSWELPTQRVDGSPLPVSEIDRVEIEAYKDGVLVASDAFPPAVTSFTLVRDTPANYEMCYRARTVDTDGQLSDWTAQACKTVKGRPNPPNNLRVK